MKNLRLFQILVLALLLMGAVDTHAQSGDAMRKLNAAKIGLITERLGLSPQQAEKFWPVYQEYAQKKREIKASLIEVKNGYNRETATEEDTRRAIKRGREIKQRKLDLEQEYSDRMLEIIDGRQLMSLQRAEDDFKAMLLRRLEQRNNQQQNREQRMERNQQRMKQRQN
ncbi:MAG: hypothetical protein JXQ96_08495 [Cyclobacteriaceae bacterium]